MADHKRLMRFRLVGEGMSPTSVRSHELADVISNVEEMIAAIVARDHPQYPKEDVPISLVEVREGTLTLEFASDLIEYAFPAYVKTTKAINAGEYDDLPADSRAALWNLIKFTKSKRCHTELWEVNGTAHMLAKITPTTELTPVKVATEMTTIYGRVIRVGGEKKPSARLVLLNGKGLTCETTRKIASELGHRLYSMVGVYGRARWTLKHLQLDAFRIEEITKYEETPIDDAFKELSIHIGAYYSDVHDVDAYVARLRSEDMED